MYKYIIIKYRKNRRVGGYKIKKLKLMFAKHLQKETRLTISFIINFEFLGVINVQNIRHGCLNNMEVFLYYILLYYSITNKNCRDEDDEFSTEAEE